MPTICNVLRCQNPTSGRFTTNDVIFMETAVCAEHLQKLQAGEPWQYNGTGRELLMGADVPRALVTAHLDENIGTGATLTLEREGDDRPYSVWLTSEMQAQLREMLRSDDDD